MRRALIPGSRVAVLDGATAGSPRSGASVSRTCWPHPNTYVANPNDGDLVDAFGDWAGDATMRRRIMVDNPARFYRF